MTKRGAELGLPDAVFDVGAAAEPRLDRDHVARGGGGQIGDDEADRVVDPHSGPAVLPAGLRPVPQAQQLLEWVEVGNNHARTRKRRFGRRASAVRVATLSFSAAFTPVVQLGLPDRRRRRNGTHGGGWERAARIGKGPGPGICATAPGSFWYRTSARARRLPQENDHESRRVQCAA